ncbi:MAG: histidine kinase [Limisphaerales bacterium]|nr:MAG: histidine kinase [Limisphaerales bacterium]
MIRHPRPAFVLLLAAWITFAVWQVVEHSRVETAAREALLRRSRDITGTLGKFIESQRRFGVVSQERMEVALQSVITFGGLQSLALLNRAGEIVASAGKPADLEARGLVQNGVHWGEKVLTVVNPMDLGTNVVVLPPRDTNAPPREDFRPPPRPPGEPQPRSGGTNTGEPYPPAAVPSAVGDNPGAGAVAVATNRLDRRDAFRRPPGGSFGRPPWLSEAEFKRLTETRTTHGFLIALSTDPLLRAKEADFVTRALIVGFAGVAALGVALALRNLSKSADLQFRLLRASEMNSHLREMNLAAAGLAHETKNPLNIIRGLAQMISKQDDAPAPVREKSRGIVDEADRVTAQLNEFINYSRPREVRRSPVPLGNALNEVVRALGYDLEEKAIQLTVQPDLPRIEADEQLLRQALFNLLLNATQALDQGGEIRITATRNPDNTLTLEIRDNGPGVAPENRKEIFKPYFTTHQKGTGLGLAIVQQIVLAHGWEIECLANEPRGALFRVSHLKTLA